MIMQSTDHILLKAYKDSVRQSIPRVLQAYAIPDSMYYKRIITWKHDRDFHNLVELRDMEADTSYNRSFNDYPFFNEDLNASCTIKDREEVERLTGVNVLAYIDAIPDEVFTHPQVKEGEETQDNTKQTENK